MADRIHIRILTAEKTLYERDAGMIVAPGVEGEFGVMPEHMPFISALDSGSLQIKSGLKAEEPEEVYAIHGGFLQVNENDVLVLATAAEPKDEIDVERAKRSRERAEERLQSRGEKIDRVRAEAALKRALVRLRVASNRWMEA